MFQSSSEVNEILNRGGLSQLAAVIISKNRLFSSFPGRLSKHADSKNIKESFKFISKKYQSGKPRFNNAKKLRVKNICQKTLSSYIRNNCIDFFKFIYKFIVLFKT